MAAEDVLGNCTLASITVLAWSLHSQLLLPTLREVVGDRSPIVARSRFPWLVFFLVQQLVKLLFRGLVTPEMSEGFESGGLGIVVNIAVGVV